MDELNEDKYSKFILRHLDNDDIENGSEILAAELATNGEPIPIVFARYNETDKTGGALVSPVLAWSRMFSYGTQQSIKQLWIVSEQGHESISDTMGLGAPDLSGVFVGNGNLKTIYDQQF